MEALKLGDIRGADNIVETHILERDLLNRLLEVQVIEHFKGVAVDEKFVVALDLSVTTLNKAFRAGLFSALVSVKAETFDALHFVLPLLADDLEEALGADVLLLVGVGGPVRVLGLWTTHCIIGLHGLTNAWNCIHVGIII